MDSLSQSVGMVSRNLLARRFDLVDQCRQREQLTWREQVFEGSHPQIALGECSSGALTAPYWRWLIRRQSQACALMLPDFKLPLRLIYYFQILGCCSAVEASLVFGPCGNDAK